MNQFVLAAGFWTPALEVFDHNGLTTGLLSLIDQPAAELVRLVIRQVLQALVVPSTEAARQPAAVAGLFAGLGSDALHQPILPVFVAARGKTPVAHSTLSIDYGPGRSRIRTCHPIR